MVKTGRYQKTLIRENLLCSRTDAVDHHVGFTSNLTMHMPTRKQQLTKEQRRTAEELNAGGGMRRPQESVLKVSGHQELGLMVLELADTYLNQNPKVQADILEAIQRGSDEHQVPEEEALQSFVLRWASW